ncbi:MAG: nucleoside triphosphate pyrophosphohydrolase, partial [Candidatus Omnitrophica bacterium]|nr:nucleoside triphosphate pyrophosphohydrolase [Candidatus Omnitrophota bacterium]
MDAFNSLLEVVATLRAPGGCPWDRQQTHESIIPHLIEEAYEVVDALRNGKEKELVDELGDLLLQVLLHAQIASEEGRFDIQKVIENLHTKLVRRH